jgi:hypothetical protein
VLSLHGLDTYIRRRRYDLGQVPYGTSVLTSRLLVGRASGHLYHTVYNSTPRRDFALELLERFSM